MKRLLILVLALSLTGANVYAKKAGVMSITDDIEVDGGSGLAKQSAMNAYGDKSKDMMKFYKIMLDAEEQFQNQNQPPASKHYQSHQQSTAHGCG